jgi:hypothetical protein
MPLAFDLTSTFVMGCTLPVATTLLAMSKRLTDPMRLPSIFVPLL